VHLLGGEQGIQHHLSGSSGLERESKLPVQRSREIGSRTFGPGFESEPKPPVHGSRGS
jgi:hypothetical protein